MIVQESSSQIMLRKLCQLLLLLLLRPIALAVGRGGGRGRGRRAGVQCESHASRVKGTQIVTHPTLIEGIAIHIETHNTLLCLPRLLVLIHFRSCTGCSQRRGSRVEDQMVSEFHVQVFVLVTEEFETRGSRCGSDLNRECFQLYITLRNGVLEQSSSCIVRLDTSKGTSIRLLLHVGEGLQKRYRTRQPQRARKQ